MTDVAAVLLDLDDTLCTYRRQADELLADSFDAAAVEPLFSVESYYDRFDEFAATTDDMAELRRECFAALARENGHDPEHGRAVAREYTAARDPSNVVALPGAREAVERLGSSYRLGLVTNGQRAAQTAKLDAIGLDGAFDVEVFAGEGAPPKPDPAPFERALEALDATPGKTLHVGDSLTSDVAGAARIGIGSVWVAPSHADPGDHRPDHRVETPDELREPPWM